MQENQTTFRPSHDRRRILLIEDEYVNQEILKLFLEDRGQFHPRRVMLIDSGHITENSARRSPTYRRLP